MKALSLRQASRCETAAHAKCRCRCHGELHGKKRATVNWEAAAAFIGAEGELTRDFFEALPADDPHHVRSKAEIAKRRRMARAEARDKAIGQGTLFEIFERQFAEEEAEAAEAEEREAKSDVY